MLHLHLAVEQSYKMAHLKTVDINQAILSYVTSISWSLQSYWFDLDLARHPNKSQSTTFSVTVTSILSGTALLSSKPGMWCNICNVLNKQKSLYGIIFLYTATFIISHRFQPVLHRTHYIRSCLTFQCWFTVKCAIQTVNKTWKLINVHLWIQNT